MSDLSRQRTIAQILGEALRLLARRPFVLLRLAVVIVVPYDILVLLIARSAPLEQTRASSETVLLLALLSFAIVGPVISALQVQVLASRGRDAKAAVRAGLRSLPVVIAAEIIAGLGIGLGVLLFVIPGVILLLRWSVVAPVASLEGTDWPSALRRSAQLSARNYMRVFGLRLVVAIVNLTLINVVSFAAGTSRHAGPVALGICLDVLANAFQSLVIALLYFDLRARSA
ncbi:MAG TPA: hypothetical protein VFP55_12225 [Solirubrobacteraceae bacterium]|nr:hypothetical protein [Solirubrobacteraceae bacterium]